MAGKFVGRGWRCGIAGRETFLAAGADWLLSFALLSSFAVSPRSASANG
jgi:hypothetical protein